MSTPAVHISKPSSARVVQLDSFIPVPRGATAVAPPPLNWPTKDPGDVLDYGLDISPALVGNPGDVIATLDVSVSPNNPGDLTINSASVDGTTVVLWLGAGQTGTVYVVTMVLTTSSGRTLQRSVLLPVLYLSTPPVPPTAIETNAGLMITDQNGNPVLTG
ncbi:MAG: hypothetical protein ACP5NP_00370 [Acetobacteraceae bacterium]